MSGKKMFDSVQHLVNFEKNDYNIMRKNYQNLSAVIRSLVRKHIQERGLS